MLFANIVLNNLPFTSLMVAGFLAVYFTFPDFAHRAADEPGQLNIPRYYVVYREDGSYDVVDIN